MVPAAYLAWRVYRLLAPISDVGIGAIFLLKYLAPWGNCQHVWLWWVRRKSRTEADSSGLGPVGMTTGFVLCGSPN